VTNLRCFSWSIWVGRWIGHINKGRSGHFEFIVIVSGDLRRQGLDEESGLLIDPSSVVVREWKPLDADTSPNISHKTVDSSACRILLTSLL
jgi:hypothetical protein